MEHAQGIIRRRKLLLDKRSQGKFIFYFIGTSLVGGFIAVGIFIYLALRKIDMVMYSMRLPDTTANQLLVHEMLVASIISLIITITSFIVITRVIFMRINGPLHKFASSIIKMRSGELNCRIELRQGDEFGHFAHDLNDMKGHLVRRFKSIDHHADELIKAAQGAAIEEKDSLKKKINDRLAALEEAMRAFST